MAKVFNVKHSIYMSQGYLLVLRISEKASVFSSAEIMRSQPHILRQLTISAELIGPTKCWTNRNKVVSEITLIKHGACHNPLTNGDNRRQRNGSDTLLKLIDWYCSRNSVLHSVRFSYITDMSLRRLMFFFYRHHRFTLNRLAKWQRARSTFVG